MTLTPRATRLCRTRTCATATTPATIPRPYTIGTGLSSTLDL